MFWKFDLHSSPHIDTLLEREDVTLKELMDEEDVLQECKAQNRKLIEFLLKAECLEDLVSFIIEEPPQDMDEKIRYNLSLFLDIFSFLHGENFAVREIILMISSCWWLGSSRKPCSLRAMHIDN